MSWKNLVTAGLLCVLVSPVMAAPTLTVTGSRLTKPAVPANAIRVWNIAIAPDLALDPTTAMAMELGFQATGGDILTVSNAQNIARADTANPGNIIFGWETLTDLGAGNMKPVGTQVGTAANANKGFAALGTIVFSTASKEDVLTITTSSAVTSLAWGGAYTAGGTLAGVGTFSNGLIAQGSGAGAANFTSFSGSLAADAAGATKFLGDMNGDGNVNFGDLAGFGSALTTPATYATTFPHLNRVGRGDINGDGNFNFGDLAGFGQLLTGGGAGSGLGASSSVPEPASIALVGLALLGGIGVSRRRRS